MNYVAFRPSLGLGVPSTDLRSFARECDRARLTPAAITAMRRLADAWQLSRAEAAALIAASETGWVRICCGAWTEPLSQDQLTRVNAVAGMFRALHLLFDDDTADRWARMPNNGPVFADRSPLDTMIDDGIPGMIKVRRYLDGLRGGL